MRSFLLILVSLLVLTTRSFCGGIDSELGYLDSDSRQRIIELFSLAESKGIPGDLLEQKLHEGISKGVSGKLIYKAMQKRLEKMMKIRRSGSDLESGLYDLEKRTSAAKLKNIKKMYIYGGNNENNVVPVNNSVNKNVKVHKNQVTPGPNMDTKTDKLEKKLLEVEKKQMVNQQKINEKIEEKLLKLEQKSLKLEDKINNKRK